MSLEILLMLGVTPPVIAIIAIVTAVVKLIRNGKETKDTIMAENIELKQQLALAYTENRELKKILREHLTKIDKISRPKEE